MTFSIAARCPDSGMLGVAVSSSSPAVAARCAHVRARTGAVLSQNVTDPRLGKQVLDALGSGDGAERAVARVIDNAGHVDYRQLIRRILYLIDFGNLLSPTRSDHENNANRFRDLEVSSGAHRR